VCSIRSLGLNTYLTCHHHDRSLEAATSRLEDLAVAGVGAGHSSSGGKTVTIAEEPVHTPAAAAAAAPPPPPAAASTGQPAPAAEDPASVVAYDEIVGTKLAEWLEITRGFGAAPIMDQVCVLPLSCVRIYTSGIHKLMETGILSSDLGKSRGEDVRRPARVAPHCRGVQQA
jgi:hypothetical protein